MAEPYQLTSSSNGDSPPASNAALRIGAHLEDRRYREASAELANDLGALSEDWLNLENLIRLFRQAGQHELVMNVLLGQRAVVLGKVRLTAHLMKLCPKPRWDREVAPLLESELAARATPAVGAFQEIDHLRVFPNLDPAQLAMLIRVKYGVPELSGIADLSAAARRLKDAYAPTPRLIRRLWQHSDHRNLGLTPWTAEMKKANVFDHLCADMVVFRKHRASAHDGANLAETTVSALEQLERPKASSAAIEVFRRIHEEGPFAIATIHAAFYALTLRFYSKHMDEHVAMSKHGGRGERSRHLSTHASRMTAAFAAIKALANGQSVLIAADAGAASGNAGLELRALDSATRIDEGMAMIAYESRRPAAWYTVECRGAEIMPVFEVGPLREDRETYPHFRGRWLEFYAGQVDRFLRGNPASLALRAQLASALCRA